MSGYVSELRIYRIGDGSCMVVDVGNETAQPHLDRGEALTVVATWLLEATGKGPQLRTPIHHVKQQMRNRGEASVDSLAALAILERDFPAIRNAGRPVDVEFPS